MACSPHKYWNSGSMVSVYAPKCAPKQASLKTDH